MAGLIAGHGHGPGHDSGIVGVAPEARILSIRVTLENDDPRREDPAVIARLGGAVATGIRYAVDHHAQVISMSLGAGSGSYLGSATEAEAVQYALDHGVVLVASSGNDGAGANRRNFPAAYPGVIAVGAVDQRLRPAAFSNRHDYLSVVAPGIAIVSADGHDAYVQGDGTSSAAALVAGVAALVRARHPELSAAGVRRAIQRGTVHRPRAGRDDAYGHGVVNARLALRAAAGLERQAPAQREPEGAIVAALVGLVAAMALKVSR
jgi:subtilisin family serine protease